VRAKLVGTSASTGRGVLTIHALLQRDRKARG
jgi:hypothetical protein